MLAEKRSIRIYNFEPRPFSHGEHWNVIILTELRNPLRSSLALMSALRDGVKVVRIDLEWD